MALTMYDSVDLSQIPSNAEAVLGYVNGRWPTFSRLPELFPHAKHVSTAVSSDADADVLDIERGDATPAQAPAWVRRQLKRGVKKPGVYCAVSDARTVLSVLAAAGIPRRKVRLITAHYTGVPHLCSKACGFGMPTTADGTQYWNKALERNLDVSLLSDSFFDPGLPAAVRRRVLRAWVLAQRAHGATWAWLKRQPKFLLWRKLGGK